MSIRITIPKKISELIMYKYRLDEVQFIDEIRKLIYDIATGEANSIFLSNILSKDETDNNTKYKKNRYYKYSKETNHNKNDDYTNRLSRAVKYVNRIISEEGKISYDKLQEILNKFNVSELDLLNETNLYMKGDGYYYPLNEQ